MNMQFIINMVHDNPGEPPFCTEFRKPKKSIEYGFNTQVFRYCGTTVSLKKMGEDFFESDQEKEWLRTEQQRAGIEVSAAHKAGLMTMTHMDLFVLPKKLVEKYRDEICDERGKISIFRRKTKEIYRVLFDELFELYPMDGLIIRVGETYLHDTPYHAGNGAVTYGDKDLEQRIFVELLEFLRQEVCVRHGKYLIFRTWDCFPDRFHSNPEYYLEVTDKVQEDERLIFSMKHTALDFWRRVKFNPCIGRGKHRQVIEVQCQREYEGKGAYPSYVMSGVINGFPEMLEKKGLRDVVDNPLVCGIFAWPRGGGWYGSYLQNEFWCDLNTYVIAAYAGNPHRTEEEIFLEYACKKMCMDLENARKFYTLCTERIPEAIMRGRYIEAYDAALHEEAAPCENWIRDDRIGGLRQLNVVFSYLETNNLVEEALKEKAYAVDLWKEVRDDFKKIDLKDEKLREFIENSMEYAVRLFSIVYICFQIFAKCRRKENLADLLAEYDKAWEYYRALEQRPQASTSYSEEFMYYTDFLGLNETIEYCRKSLCS